MQQPNRDRDAGNSGSLLPLSSRALNNVGEGDYSMLQQQQWHPQLLHAFPPSMILRPGTNQPESVSLNAANLLRRHDQPGMPSQGLNASRQLSDLVRNLQQSAPNSARNGSAAQYLLASSQGSEDLKLQQLISEQLQRLVATTPNVNPSMYSSMSREAQQASSGAPKQNSQFPVLAPKSTPSPQLLLSAIIPCRARGMPSEHNSKSAYFVMPTGIEHGGDLVCSFSACRNEGIKFCYCSHCGIPVAKRNFRQRHAHESQTKKQAKAPAPAQATSRNFLRVQSQLANSVAPSSKSKLPPPAPKLKRPYKEDHCSKGEHSGTSTNSSIDTDQSCDAHKQPKPMSSLVFPLKGRQVVSGGSDGAVSSSLNHTQQLQIWASLLRQRPSDKNGDDMSAWLQSVIEVSNPLAHSAESTIAEVTAANKRQTSRNSTSVDAPADGAANNTSGSAESSPSEGDGTSGSDDGLSSDSNSDDDDYAKKVVNEAELIMRGSNINPRGGGGSGSTESSTPAKHVSGEIDTSETGHHTRSSGNNKESRHAKK